MDSDGDPFVLRHLHCVDVYYRQTDNIQLPLRPRALKKGSYADALQLAAVRANLSSSRMWLLQTLYEEEFKVSFYSPTLASTVGPLNPLRGLTGSFRVSSQAN